MARSLDDRDRDLLPRVRASLAVFGVGDKAVTVIIAAAAPLACRIRADSLPRPEL